MEEVDRLFQTDYATEVHLFIRDLNQSPFNVGTRVALEDFTRPQVARLAELVGGHPCLTRRA